MKTWGAENTGEKLDVGVRERERTDRRRDKVLVLKATRDDIGRRRRSSSSSSGRWYKSGGQSEHDMTTRTAISYSPETTRFLQHLRIAFVSVETGSRPSAPSSFPASALDASLVALTKCQSNGSSRSLNGPSAFNHLFLPAHSKNTNPPHPILVSLSPAALFFSIPRHFIPPPVPSKKEEKKTKCPDQGGKTYFQWAVASNFGGLFEMNWNGQEMKSKGEKRRRDSVFW